MDVVYLVWHRVYGPFFTFYSMFVQKTTNELTMTEFVGGFKTKQHWNTPTVRQLVVQILHIYVGKYGFLILFPIKIDGFL